MQEEAVSESLLEVPQGVNRAVDRPRISLRAGGIWSASARTRGEFGKQEFSVEKPDPAADPT
jgi:hypothetical protein